MLNTLVEDNFIIACDSYKVGHIAHLPDGILRSHSCIVARKPFVDKVHGIEINEIVVLGPQMVARILASVKITDAMIDEAEIECNEQGYDFPRAKWEEIRDLGYLPLAVKAVPEGTILPVGLPIMDVDSTTKGFAWLVAYVETWAQDIVWTMSTIASKVRWVRQQVDTFTENTGTDYEYGEYMIHNFGDRGAGGQDRAIMAAIAHAVFFSGSDCLRANRYLKKYYKATGPVLSSVDANEHSTVCANSDCENKDDSAAFEMTLKNLERAVERSKRGIGVPVTSNLIDTFDDERYIKEFLIPNVKRIEEIIGDSGGRYVCRPDSGDAIKKPIEVGNWLRTGLRERKIYGTINVNDFWTGPAYLGTIQGDGLKMWDFPTIFRLAETNKLAAANFVFGWGGGLTNGSTRDDFSFSMKATANQMDDGTWVDLQKDPKTDPGKKSLKGRATVALSDSGQLVLAEFGDGADIMERIYKNGWVSSYTFDEVRERARA
jgi:nicotinamide phosphoribosyltransferase